MLRNIDLLKSNEISKFDSCYEGEDKTKILKVSKLYTWYLLQIIITLRLGMEIGFKETGQN